MNMIMNNNTIQIVLSSHSTSRCTVDAILMHEYYSTMITIFIRTIKGNYIPQIQDQNSRYIYALNINMHLYRLKIIIKLFHKQ